ncbi:hypothetical protein M0802_000590 [Mischocyttarus mexicanus]|nr:hypothetical protein M0802_000590 [Mischocyttarus mexicanus]
MYFEEKLKKDYEGKSPNTFNMWKELRQPPFGQIDPIIQGLLMDTLLSKILKDRLKITAYYNPWNHLIRKGEGGTSTVRADKNKFQVLLDVQQFEPEDIKVKVVDHFVVVEAKHDEKQDEHGWISRKFTRKYIIPQQCDIDQVTSTLSSDGVLAICAPRILNEDEKLINIEHTGKRTFNDPPVKESNDEEKSND